MAAGARRAAAGGRPAGRRGAAATSVSAGLPGRWRGRRTERSGTGTVGAGAHSAGGAGDAHARRDAQLTRLSRIGAPPHRGGDVRAPGIRGRSHEDRVRLRHREPGISSSGRCGSYRLPAPETTHLATRYRTTAALGGSTCADRATGRREARGPTREYGARAARDCSASLGWLRHRVGATGTDGQTPERRAPPRSGTCGSAVAADARRRCARCAR